MEVTQRLDELESELKIVKNEVQSVLLDVREHVLSYSKNPFQMINFRPPAPKDEAEEEDENSGGRRREAGGAPAAAQGIAVDQAGGTDMANQEANNQLKALMDQLERDRQALKVEKEEMAQQAAAIPQSPPPPQPQPSPVQPAYGGGGQFNPGFQSDPLQYPQQPPPGYGFGQQPMYPSTPPGQGFSQPAQPQQSSAQPARSMQASRRSEREMPSQGDAGRPSSSRKRFSGEITDMEEEAQPVNAGRRASGGARHQERRGDSDAGRSDGSQVNLLTLVGLVRWVEKSIRKIGREKLEAILEIYQTAGYLPTSQKEVITQILKLADGEKPEGPVTMGVSIQVLLELDSLMGGKFQTESSILSTLFTEDGGYPWTKQ